MQRSQRLRNEQDENESVRFDIESSLKSSLDKLDNESEEGKPSRVLNSFSSSSSSLASSSLSLTTSLSSPMSQFSLSASFSEPLDSQKSQKHQNQTSPNHKSTNNSNKSGNDDTADVVSSSSSSRYGNDIATVRSLGFGNSVVSNATLLNLFSHISLDLLKVLSFDSLALMVGDLSRTGRISESDKMSVLQLKLKMSLTGSQASSA
jgi:hypothetical protein